MHLFLDEIHSQAFLSTSTSLTLLVHEINKISSKSNRQNVFIISGIKMIIHLNI